MPTVYVMTYSKFGRIAAVATAAIFAIAPTQVDAVAADAHDDVRVTAIHDTCLNTTTVYDLRLENRGDRGRRVHGDIARTGAGAISETFAYRIPAGRGAWQRITLREGQRAVVTIRSAGAVVVRAHVTAHCRKIVH